jgi:hypothetical protein
MLGVDHIASSPLPLVRLAEILTIVIRATYCNPGVSSGWLVIYLGGLVPNYNW